MVSIGSARGWRQQPPSGCRGGPCGVPTPRGSFHPGGRPVSLLAPHGWRGGRRDAAPTRPRRRVSRWCAGHPRAPPAGGHARPAGAAASDGVSRAPTARRGRPPRRQRRARARSGRGGTAAVGVGAEDGALRLRGSGTVRAGHAAARGGAWWRPRRGRVVEGGLAASGRRCCGCRARLCGGSTSCSGWRKRAAVVTGRGAQGVRYPGRVADDEGSRAIDTRGPSLELLWCFLVCHFVLPRRGGRVCPVARGAGSDGRRARRRGMPRPADRHAGRRAGPEAPPPR